MPKQYIISENGTRGIPIEVEKPKEEDFWNYEKCGAPFFDGVRFSSARINYNAALEEAKKHAIPIVPAVPEWDGQVVNADKFQEGIGKSDTEFCDECGAPLNTTVLVPIHTNKNLDYHKLNKDFTKTLQEIDSEALNQYSQIPHTDHREESKDWKTKFIDHFQYETLMRTLVRAPEGGYTHFLNIVADWIEQNKSLISTPATTKE